MLTCEASYAVETVPTKFRHFATAFVNMCWVIGHIMCVASSIYYRQRLIISGAGILNGTLPLTGDWGWKL